MQFKSLSKSHKSIFLSALLIFVLLETTVLLLMQYKNSYDEAHYMQNYTADFKTHTDIANSHLSDIADLIYRLDIDTPKMELLMYRATQTQDTQALATLRAELYRMFSPSYALMQKYGVRQLHFHLPKAVSFLRFHRPKKFGDSLMGVRATIDYVDENEVSIAAFEEGRIFNGFRNVYPIFYAKKLVGTVEISFSFDGMQDVLSKIDASTYFFMIQKSVVGAKVFNSEKSNYEQSEFKAFLYDKNTLHNRMEIPLAITAKINAKIAKEADAKLEKGEFFSLLYHNKEIYKNHSIVVTFLPITNLDDKTVAYIVHYAFADFIDILRRNNRLLLLVLTIVAFLLTGAFVSMLANERKKLKTLHSFATHDALTKIYNRHGANELIVQMMAQSRRDKQPLSVIFFDIDFFKRVNDTYGHEMGDYVLENIARIVSEEIRESDVFARWGGEEFIIFLPKTPLKSASSVAEKLRRVIEHHAFSEIESITCSFGVATLDAEETKGNLLKRVDALLYEAKESGRNRVVDEGDKYVE